MPILPKERDPRLITLRRGGSLTDDAHHLLAAWAIECAEQVLPLFESEAPDDARVREALEAGRAWIRGELRMSDARQAAFGANAAAREKPDPARLAALSAGQAAAVPHVAAHELGAAAYAVRAARAAALAAGEDGEAARRAERDRQRARLPEAVRDLVLDDQRQRSSICWGAFDD